MHRRPLGRGRTLAALVGAAHRRRLRPAVVAGRRHARHPAASRQRPGGQRDRRLPRRDRRRSRWSPCRTPRATDRSVWIAGCRSRSSPCAGWIGFRGGSSTWRCSARSSSASRPQIFTNGPGVWLAAIGLVVLSRAAYKMTGESAYR